MNVKMKKYERKDNMAIIENNTKMSIRNRSQKKEQNRRNYISSISCNNYYTCDTSNNQH